ncbi:MAG TPA: hypothetical protein VF152_12280 [Acidimicrobiia bacterium]
MPSMPNYFVGKGAQFELIDDQFGGDRKNFMAAYDAALGRIDRDTIVELARRHTAPERGARLTPGDIEHFEQDWIGYWDKYPVEQVLRAGYRKAIERAREVEKPIESLWVCADEDAFQVYVCEGPRQITVLVFTPPPIEHVGEEHLTEEEPIWVVKARDEYDHGEVESAVPAGDREIIVRRIPRAPQAEHHFPSRRPR